MENSYLITKLGGKLPEQLGRKPNFRYKHQSRSALCQNPMDQINVDSRLSGAGHAIEQRTGRPILFH